MTSWWAPSGAHFSFSDRYSSPPVLSLWPVTCLTPEMSDTEDTGEIDVTIETEVIDVDGDGVADMVIETTTTVIDIDGDGVADVVSETTTTMYDVDGDGVVDAVEETTITTIDVDGDGVADVVEVTTTSATDIDGDGEFDVIESIDDHRSRRGRRRRILRGRDLDRGCHRRARGPRREPRQLNLDS